MQAFFVKNRSITLGTSVALALIVAMGGASRRLTAAAECVAQKCAGDGDQPSRDTPDHSSLNPALFGGEQVKTLPVGGDQAQAVVAAARVAHRRTGAIHGIRQSQSSSNAKLLSLQARFVRLQV